MLKQIILVSFLFFPACGDYQYEPKWENYDSTLKERIDSANCQQLQEQFDIAYANSDRQMARTGSNNSDLMGYIDEKMQMKKCY
tara:strand:- start:627 stop:878 length:252 start_codon:yes stop_codon:yes gene_type:complete